MIRHVASELKLHQTTVTRYFDFARQQASQANIVPQCRPLQSCKKTARDCEVSWKFSSVSVSFVKASSFRVGPKLDEKIEVVSHSERNEERAMPLTSVDDHCVNERSNHQTVASGDLRPFFQSCYCCLCSC